jgi:hypothetical protein
VDAEGLEWVFTEGHAVMDYTDFFDDFADLKKIDWPLMSSKFWFDRPEYPDRCRRREAEFLVHDFFPWKLVSAIGVCNTAIAQQTKRILAGRKLPVSVQRDWYYE